MRVMKHRSDIVKAREALRTGVPTHGKQALDLALYIVQKMPKGLEVLCMTTEWRLACAVLLSNDIDPDSVERVR